MKEIMMKYARYNLWANKCLTDAMANLNDEQAEQVIISSFPSLHKTVLHTWSAENVWLQRLELVLYPVWPAAEFKGSFVEACGNWMQSSALLAGYAENLPEDRMQEYIHYHDLRNNPHATQIADMLQHVFNHSTYHRGQLVTMLRQLGVTEIPGTDYIGYVRMNK